MGDLIGLLFMVFCVFFVFAFVYNKFKFYKGRLRKNIEPDAVEAALLRKQLAIANELATAGDRTDIPVLGRGF